MRKITINFKKDCHYANLSIYVSKDKFHDTLFSWEDKKVLRIYCEKANIGVEIKTDNIVFIESSDT